MEAETTTAILCEWHVMDEDGQELWVWGETEEDAKQQAKALNIGKITYCKRTRDEKSFMLS
jgi:hypothetical protein